MSWNGRKNKKEIPADIKVRRGKAMLICIAVMVIVIIFAPHKTKTETPEANPVEDIMNANLDSLIRSLGFDDYDVFYTGEIEELHTEETCDAEILLDIIDNKIENIKTMETDDRTRTSLLTRASAVRDSLVNEVLRFNDSFDSETFHSRRIRFSTGNGRTYTFFQEQWHDGAKAECFHESLKNNIPTPKNQ